MFSSDVSVSVTVVVVLSSHCHFHVPSQDLKVRTERVAESDVIHWSAQNMCRKFRTLIANECSVFVKAATISKSAKNKRVARE